MPDIQLLPQLAVIFGVTIDELFSMTDDSRMDRIENMIEGVRFLTQSEFADAERFLQEKIQSEDTRARGTQLLAMLYVKRGNEYHELASPLARKALLLNPDEKPVHNAIFDSERGPYEDWNVSNHWELIEFYKEFVQMHPENPRTYLWLMDLLIEDGRTAEAKEYLAQMDRIEHTFRTDMYAGLIAKEECDLPLALAYWEHMTEEFPDHWLPWSSRGDAMARLCRYEEAKEFYLKSMELQPVPRFVDTPEAVSQIAEIQGDYETAIAMREVCIDMCRTDWGLTDGEWVDRHKREIQRLQEKLNQ